MTREFRTGPMHTISRTQGRTPRPVPGAADSAWYRTRTPQARAISVRSDFSRVATLATLVILAAFAMSLLQGCSAANRFDADEATRAYPYALHTTDTVDIQLFRDETDIELVNSTGTTYTDFDLWLNQRYVAHVDSLPAGATIRLSLWDFYDELGESINAGGFFRTRTPDKVRLAEMQFGEDTPMIGLITIRSEDVRRRETIR